MNRFYTGIIAIFIAVLCFNFGFKTEAQDQKGFTENNAAVSPNIVISQFFGGGGVASASPFRNDFVELFNRGSSPVNLNGWSVQYSFAGDSSWQITALPNVTIAAGTILIWFNLPRVPTAAARLCRHPTRPARPICTRSTANWR